MENATLLHPAGTQRITEGRRRAVPPWQRQQNPTGEDGVAPGSYSLRDAGASTVPADSNASDASLDRGLKQSARAGTASDEPPAREGRHYSLWRMVRWRRLSVRPKADALTLQNSSGRDASPAKRVGSTWSPAQRWT